MKQRSRSRRPAESKRQSPPRPAAPVDLLGFFAARGRSPLTAREVLSHFPGDRLTRQTLLAELDRLVAEGQIHRSRDRRYSRPVATLTVRGRLSLHRDGYGFVAAADGDLYIPAFAMAGAMHGDEVEVRLVRPARRGSRPEGEVARVVERAWREVVGLYAHDGTSAVVHPNDRQFGYPLLIPPEGGGGARAGEVVVARIERYPGFDRPPLGKVVEVLGQPDDPAVEVYSVARKHGLPYRFSAAAENEAAAFTVELTTEDWASRRDLRHLPLVTIDGEDARDFDDAVAGVREDDGFRVWVAIADVSWYVRPGSAIDAEALERGTSVYFPDRCLPMLPGRLSTDLCSLRPDVDRLVQVAELSFDGRGERLTTHCYAAVMRSRARLTYTTVAAHLVGEETDLSAEIGVQLHLLDRLAQQLQALRRRRGSLDLDLPEAKIALDERGRPVDVSRAPRTTAHSLIEELMLAANEAVAELLTTEQVPLLYRVHDRPDPEKLEFFQHFVAQLGYGADWSDESRLAHGLQRILAAVRGQNEERVVNQLLLRSLRQAGYSATNGGHFGLASPCYCHFTSPIRRYPDLLVHRALRAHQLGAAAPRQELLLPLGERLSRLERRAMEAEREVVDLKKCQFMSGHLGEELVGTVSGLQPFGFFVELQNWFVEGLVPLAALRDDYYYFDVERQRLIGERRRRIIGIGDCVTIRVARVDCSERHIDFELVDEQSPQSAAVKGRSGYRRRFNNRI